MDERELLAAFLNATSTQQVETALDAYVVATPGAEFLPVGRRSNNRGTIEVGSGAIRPIVERITNMIDAVLELEHEKHGGTPACRSPREAADAWLGVPEQGGLSALTDERRRDLAAQAVVRLEPGEGPEARILTVLDRGIGIKPDDLEGTILSLNESNKIRKPYLAGIYGQGGSSTFGFCQYAAIVSRRHGSDRVGFTLVKYEYPSPEDFKAGRYVFLVRDGVPPAVWAAEDDIAHGTVVRHFGYDLTGYDTDFGPKSVHGLLERIMFAPVSAIRFENRIHDWNRTVTGTKNALTGNALTGNTLNDPAGEGGDTADVPTPERHVPMFDADLGDYGCIGIEYWVLTAPEPAEGKKQTKPADHFVDATKPVILTHNGQNQGEISGTIVANAKSGADLPFLQTQGRIVCHVNCDRLSVGAKRLMFASTREQSREGLVLDRIKAALVGALKADDRLVHLNKEARERSLKDTDSAAQQKVNQRVSKLVRSAGAAFDGDEDRKGDAKDDKKAKKPRTPRPKPPPIEPQDPPTFLRILLNEKKKLQFRAGQQRHIRVETDANADYHNPEDPGASRLNIAVGDDLRVFETSPLKGGRMRIGLECPEDAAADSTGSLRLELRREGLPALDAEREYQIVEPPKPKEQEEKDEKPEEGKQGQQRDQLREFVVIAVPGPRDDKWKFICDDSGDTEVKRHASNFVINDNKLYVYYSEAFPRLAAEVRRFGRQSEALAASFRTRYESWLAFYALMMANQKPQTDDSANLPESVSKEMGRQERSRLAIMATLVAAEEVRSSLAAAEGENAAAAA